MPEAVQSAHFFFVIFFFLLLVFSPTHLLLVVFLSIFSFARSARGLESAPSYQQLSSQWGSVNVLLTLRTIALFFSLLKKQLVVAATTSGVILERLFSAVLWVRHRVNCFEWTTTTKWEKEWRIGSIENQTGTNASCVFFFFFLFQCFFLVCWRGENGVWQEGPTQ